MTETYLYIKQHEITGLKYFGKTTKKDPYKYNGSGKYWTRHIKKHGVERVKTIWCKLFTDIDELQRVALAMSEMYDIVDSEFWANMQPENGLDGGLTKEYLPEKTKQKISEASKGNKAMLGKTHSEETKQKMSEARSKQIMKPHTEESKQKMSDAKKGNKPTEETKQKLSAAQKGKSKPIIICPHCNKSGSVSNMKRWHFDYCKEKNNG